MPSLSKLRVSNLRNISYADLELNESFNIFFGPNGAGKTSFLESLSVLSTTRSFRSIKTQFLVKNDESETVVSGTLKGKLSEKNAAAINIGVSKPKVGKCVVKVDGLNARVSSEIARLFPVLSIDPNSFQLLEGGPQERRSMVDWLTFHVKPDFFSAFKDYARCLKQRNKLLRSDKIEKSDLQAWDKLLCASAVVLDRARRQAVSDLSQLLSESYSDRFDGTDLSLEYRSGWGESLVYEAVSDDAQQDQALMFEEKLQQCFDRDKRMGYSTLGSHKYDVLIKVDCLPASEILSRGQKKQLIICFYLALAKLFSSSTGKYPVLLLDDLPSELDRKNLAWLLSSIQELGTQTFITSIDALDIHSLIELEKTEASWFHVKHGNAIARNDFGSK